MRKPVIGTALTLGALLLGLSAGCGDGRQPESPPQQGPSVEAQAAIIGSWRPTSIPGYTPPARSRTPTIGRR